MLRQTPAGVTLAVRTQPGAKKTAILGIYGDGANTQLKVAVQAPPVEGKANSALIAFLAEFFQVSKNQIEIINGELSRSKVFLLRGVDLEEARARLASAT